LPIKTYNSLEVDPISSITNVLTKLAKDEEAVVQIILRQSNSNWYNRGRKILREIGQGKNLQEAIAATNWWNTLKVKSEKEQKEEKEAQTARRVDEELVKAMETKLNKNSFDTNIRLVVSIKNARRSEEVFKQLQELLTNFRT